MVAVPTLITALVWSVLVVVPLAGLCMVAMPFVLDWAQTALRTHPPAGTPRARRLWYGRERLYQAIFAALAAVGGVVFLLAWLSGVGS